MALRAMLAGFDKKIPGPTPAFPVMPRDALPVVFNPSLRAEYVFSR